MKNVFKQITILCLIVLAGSVIFCKKKAEEEPEPSWLRVYNAGVFEDSINVTGWEVNEDVIWIGSFYYPWQGEDSINYDCYRLFPLINGGTEEIWNRGSVLRVNGKLVGINTNYVDTLEIAEPHDVITATVWDCEECLEVSLEKFPNLVGIWVSVDDSNISKTLDVIPQDIRLYVFCFDATNRSLRELSKFLNIRILYLERDRITNCGLRHLAKLKELRWLRIPGFYDKINSKGRKYLKALHKLRSLNLYYRTT
ncbi:MAG: hypothetical protein E3J71_04420 [Candidatus Stahlbacteria bacterium]|nr:MAG: hypothetical protein E3J71_04420 [Candidatus Stahlbacteria bacterium]